jgi:hypothetical protein
MDTENNQTNQNQESVESGVKRVVIIAIIVALVTVGGGWIMASQLASDEQNDTNDTPSTGTTTDDVINDDEDIVSTDEKREGCELVGGEYNEYDECVGINESQCATLGGEWESCGSACRHDADAELCTKQCVQFCQL